MLLYGQYDSPFVRRVGVTLHLLGIPFEHNTMSVFADAAAMREVNPLGRIPSLRLDSGEVLIDSAAILDHIDETVGPERALTPRSGSERRAALRIIAFATGVVDKAGAIAYEHMLRPPEKVHGPWLDRCKTQLESTLVALEAIVPASGWLGGARPMQADVTLACALAYVRLRAPEIGPLAGSHPRLARHSRAAEALPAFIACLPAPVHVGGPAEQALLAVERMRGHGGSP
jgi:glutathione S-transferase